MPKYIFHPTDFNQLKDHYDLIIIGSGSTGLVSAIQAHELGLHPIVLEKMAKLGGNSTRASSGMNAAETNVQLKHHIIDSYEAFYQDTFIGGDKQNNKDLLHYFTTHAALSIDWLADHGIHLDDLTITGGMHTKRTHRPSSTAPIGAFLITNFLKIIEKDHIPVFNNVRVKKLLQDHARIDGVEADFKEHGKQTIHSKAVILATGGFGASKEIIGKYRKDLVHYKTTNQSGATGDGLKLATGVGADLVDMSKIQVHPTVQQDTPHAFLIGEAIRGEGAILVNQNGQRFVNELDTRKNVTHAINQLSDKHAYLILDQGIRNHAKAIDFYDSIGLVIHGNDIAELAHHINVDSDKLNQTINEWNQDVKNHRDAKFHRTTGMDRGIDRGPYFAIHIAPAVHYTMGGIKVNHLTQVLNHQEQPVKGLFASGEVAGGLHGDNRIGGNSIAETVIFGRQAGQQAFKYIQEKQ
ncbi:flavocytochrome c [Philodulcilactobacillus myokoensis]|uniref:Flavocytochrome c n=2 Tax=Philodulcilactobacillus myokoensis TaxID=2929573 RepID=A0A9W6ET17_9LACO|nr:flavocytochrome c [Philodulcilactobacillus myokoensis]GLB47616.1 flavocytochrome c [Philodulcilactobacillus myokoensis]